MTGAPHPESVIRTADGRMVQLKVHRAIWSGDYPENSLPAIAECYRERVARTEIDIHPLSDEDFVVLHDPVLDALTTGSGPVTAVSRREMQALRLRFQGGTSSEPPPLFSEVVDLIQRQEFPTLVELDMPNLLPLPWPRVEALARLVEPVKDRVIFNGADWNMRRLLRVDPTLPMSIDPGLYLDWVPEGDADEGEMPFPRGAYGYFDGHVLARERYSPLADYLEDRLGAIARLVPGARDAHLRLAAFEHMLDQGVIEAAGIFHRLGLSLDVWTLNAGTPGWHERLTRVLAAGVDCVTSDTARVLATTENAPPI